ncbi:hypothetical protein [Bordetella bronchialis]|uniref:Phosphoglycerate mutase n=1 Tax=Bordetella bronchialis TaxID=463025 RepID=A0A193FZ90_9BORD|nr:hypothetical protein [Bordetella bronchialis]ANN72703.1 hypothetical protein BAU08_16280 [Bordetella bronchialis]
MQIVLPGALPPSAPIAAELAKRLPTAAPTLYAWMRLGQGRQTPFEPHEHGCTPYEAWQLEQAGFRPPAGQALGAGLGPLRADAPAIEPEQSGTATRRPGPPPAGASIDPAAPVWVADLAHIALGTDRASLVPAEALDLTEDEGAALFDAARPLFDGTPFGAAVVRPYRWRVSVPDGIVLRTASPAAVAGQPLNAWWSQDASARPWRRLLNEIQMAWHEHPVNAARAARGQLPANGLWLYGGAAPWPRPATPAALPHIADDLLAAFQAEDWGSWLRSLERLDAQALKPRADDKGRPRERLTLTLLGRDRRATLDLQPRGPLLRWLPAREHSWRTWWSPPA